MADALQTTVMTPLGDRVVLRIHAAVRERESGLILPEGARVRYDAPLVADVIDVGPNCTRVWAGAKVLVATRADGVDVTIPDQGTLRIVGERAIIAVLADEQPTTALIADYERLVRRLFARQIIPRSPVELAQEMGVLPRPPRARA